MSADQEKKAAALRALDLVEDGMKVGIGTGSTADHFTRGLGEKVAAGFKVVGVPTSEATATLAKSLNIPLTTLDEAGTLDLTVDGADEADSSFRLIKGGGGALLREKIVARASKRMAVIVDSSKLVPTLGAFKLPVEIVPFGADITRTQIEKGAAEFGTAQPLTVSWRKRDNGDLFLTDGGHYILDCAFEEIRDAEGLTRFLLTLPGVVETGLFLGLATEIIVARGDETEILTR